MSSIFKPTVVASSFFTELRKSCSFCWSSTVADRSRLLLELELKCFNSNLIIFRTRIETVSSRARLNLSSILGSTYLDSTQVVCALRSLSIMGGIINLIICAKMAWSERVDYGWISSGRSWKRKSVQFSGKKQSHSVDKCILVYFVRNHLHPVCNWPRKVGTETLCSMLQSWKALEVRSAVRRKFWIHREISATSAKRYWYA